MQGDNNLYLWKVLNAQDLCILFDRGVLYPEQMTGDELWDSFPDQYKRIETTFCSLKDYSGYGLSTWFFYPSLREDLAFLKSIVSEQDLGSLKYAVQIRILEQDPVLIGDETLMLYLMNETNFDNVDTQMRFPKSKRLDYFKELSRSTSVFSIIDQIKPEHIKRFVPL